MLRYHIFFRIVPILSIINFALTAPVLVQDSEEHQANVNAVHKPKDVLMKRGDGDIAKLAEEYLTPAWGKPVDSSDTHTLSGTAPDPASSTTNRDPSCSPSMQGLGARGNCFGLPKSSAPPVPDHGPTDAELSPIRPELSIDGSYSPTEASSWDSHLGLYPPMEAAGRTPGSSSPMEAPSRSYWDAFYSPMEAAGRTPGWSSPSSPMEAPSPGSSWGAYLGFYQAMEAADRTPGSSWDSYLHTSGPLRWYGSEDNLDTLYQLNEVLPPTKISSHPVSPSSYSPTQTKIYAHSDPGTADLEDGVDHVPLPPPDPELTAPELQLDHQSLGTDSQPDLSASTSKGKAKVSRRVSGTAKDVGNLAERELQGLAEEVAWE